jgi:hypothetical protein
MTNILNNEIDEFHWVLKVLQSSKTMEHLLVCDKLFSLFINKWNVTKEGNLKKYNGLYNRFKFVTKNKLKKIV